MVRDINGPKEFNKMKMSGEYKDGTIFEGKDFPSAFLGDRSNIISYWNDQNHLIIAPLQDIKYIELYTEEE